MTTIKMEGLVLSLTILCFSPLVKRDRFFMTFYLILLSVYFFRQYFLCMFEMTFYTQQNNKALLFLVINVHLKTGSNN